MRLVTGAERVTVHAAAPASGRNWPGFRGDGTSHTAARDLPTQWSDDSGVAWQVPLEGRGQSSPVIWNDAVYVTAVAGTDKETLLVSRVDLATGVVRWAKRFPASRKLSDTDTTSKAAPTPVVNAAGVVTLFESGDILALAHDGTLRWQRSLMDEYGDINNGHQYGSSPVLVRDALMIFVGHRGPSYLLRLDAGSGRTVWKADRPPITSWNTPVIGGAPGQEWIAVPARSGFDAHRLSDGAPLWSRTGVIPALMASATVSGDHLVVPSSTKGGSGALSERLSEPTWMSDEATVEFSSPLVADGVAFFVNPVGVVYATHTTTGATFWKHRLPGACWASPLSDGRHVYFFGVEGKTVVMTLQTDQPVVVSENALTLAGRVYGLAAVDGAFILRTDRTLVKVTSVRR
jgi:outer membrane protein assembly factor BamB